MFYKENIFLILFISGCFGQLMVKSGTKVFTGICENTTFYTFFLRKFLVAGIGYKASFVVSLTCTCRCYGQL